MFSYAFPLIFILYPISNYLSVYPLHQVTLGSVESVVVGLVLIAPLTRLTVFYARTYLTLGQTQLVYSHGFRTTSVPYDNVYKIRIRNVPGGGKAGPHTIIYLYDQQDKRLLKTTSFGYFDPTPFQQQLTTCIEQTLSNQVKMIAQPVQDVGDHFGSNQIEIMRQAVA